jgi:hypothetical protein
MDYFNLYPPEIIANILIYIKLSNSILINKNCYYASKERYCKDFRLSQLSIINNIDKIPMILFKSCKLLNNYKYYSMTKNIENENLKIIIDGEQGFDDDYRLSISEFVDSSNPNSIDDSYDTDDDPNNPHHNDSLTNSSSSIDDSYNTDDDPNNPYHNDDLDSKYELDLITCYHILTNLTFHSNIKDFAKNYILNKLSFMIKKVNSYIQSIENDIINYNENKWDIFYFHYKYIVKVYIYLSTTAYVYNIISYEDI